MKLTGASGGGCAFSILKQNLRPGSLDVLDGVWAKEGFTKYQTILGGDGVGVLWPATQLTREAFVAAKDHEEVEKLVGIGSLGTGRLG